MDSLSSSLINTGMGGMPRVSLAAPDGARADVYLYGAHVTSWVPAAGKERLFLSRTSEFRPGAAIRGGVPVIFPQFGALGTLPRHGFARTLSWELISIGGDQQNAAAKFALQDNDTTRSLWPHPFKMELGITVGGLQLALALSVTNSGETPFEFTGALHTYLRVDNIQDTFIEGLHRIRFHDTVNRPSPTDWVEMQQTEPEVHFPGEIDRVYYNVSQPLRIYEPGNVTRVATDGFPDVVIWNPGAEKSARLGDMEPDGYLHMVCVEAAIAGAPVKLAPDESWHGIQSLTV